MKYFFLTPFFFTFFCMPLIMHAAVLFFDVPHTIGVGDTFEVAVMLDTEGESVNALEGIVVFDEDTLTFVSARTGGSIVPLWVTEPQYISGGFVFRGIIPGGFTGVAESFATKTKPGRIFSILFEAKRVGETGFSFDAVEILRNAETPEPVTLEAKKSAFSIVANVSEPNFDTVYDTEPPLPFHPVIVSDPEFFGGETVLLWNTHDKESGVAYYELFISKKELQEGASVSWTRVKSPHVLSKGDIKQYLYVKAVDYAGNEYIAEVSPQKSFLSDRFVISLVVFFIVSLVLLYLFSILIIKRKRI